MSPTPPVFSDWQVFFHDQATPADAQAYSLGKSVFPISPLSFAMEDDSFDLNTIRPAYPACGEEGFAIAAATIHSDAPCTVNLGVSTEWWMEIYLNGTMVGSTRETGNGIPDFTPLAHAFPMNLAAGENRFAAWLHHSHWYVHWPFSAAILPEAPAFLDPMAPLSRLRQAFWPRHERIVAGPFLKAADGRLQIQVELYQPYAAILQFRRQGDADWTEFKECVLGQLPTDTRHRFDLPALAPGTTYEDRLMTADTSLFHEEYTPVYSFRTPDAARPIHRNPP